VVDERERKCGKNLKEVCVRKLGDTRDMVNRKVGRNKKCKGEKGCRRELFANAACRGCCFVVDRRPTAAALPDDVVPVDPYPLYLSTPLILVITS